MNVHDLCYNIDCKKKEPLRLQDYRSGMLKMNKEMDTWLGGGVCKRKKNCEKG